MPVIPDNVPPFQILPPSTSGDNGEPSASLWKDAKRMIRLVHDERLLVAEKLLLDIRRRLDDWTSVNNGASSPSKSPSRRNGFKVFGHKNKLSKQEAERLANEVQHVKTLLDQNEDLLKRLENRSRLLSKAKQSLSVDDDWTFACQHFGITTFYRRESDGSLSVKLEGELKDVPLFEQICVLKEVDLHYRWAPFCSSSMTIADLDKIDTVGWFLIGMPHFGISRDGCFRAIGCDCIEEDGTIILTAQGVQDRKPNSQPPDDSYLSADPIIQKLDIPPVPKRRGSGRMTIKKFDAMIQITSPTSATTRIVANVDPNLSFLPQTILEFVMKHMAGVLLAKLQAAAKKVNKHPAHNDHAKRMRAESGFYKEWLMPKFESLCLQRSWEMPRVVVFDFTDALPYHRSSSFNGHKTTSNVEENLSILSENGARENRSDSVSDLSVASTRSKNPLASYLHKREDRARQKAEDKVAASRKMAADRLKPKQVHFSKLERLKDLKAVKLHQVVGRNASVESTADDLDDESFSPARSERKPKPSLSQMATTSLHSHPVWVRLLVVSALLAAESVMLHVESIPHVGGFILSEPSNPWIVVLDDVGAIFYMLACAFMDYLLCFVALVYTFTSLDLGAKAGSKIKQYYADNIALLVGGKSLAISGLSLTKALTKVALRSAMKLGLRIILSCSVPFSWLRSAVFRNPLFRAMESSMASYLEGFTQRFESVDWIVRPLYGCCHFVFERLCTLISETTIARSVKRLQSSVHEGFAVYRGGAVTHEQWRADALQTGRFLYTYSTVFVLSCLLVFSLTAMRSRTTGKVQGKHVKRVKPRASSIDELTVSDTKSNSTAEAVDVAPPSDVLSGVDNKETSRTGVSPAPVSRRGLAKYKQGKRMTSTPVITGLDENSGPFLSHAMSL